LRIHPIILSDIFRGGGWITVIYSFNNSLSYP
jgi:hypothetical protein